MGFRAGEGCSLGSRPSRDAEHRRHAGHGTGHRTGSASTPCWPWCSSSWPRPWRATRRQRRRSNSPPPIARGRVARARAQPRAPKRSSERIATPLVGMLAIPGQPSEAGAAKPGWSPRSPRVVPQLGYVTGGSVDALGPYHEPVAINPDPPPPVPGNAEQGGGPRNVVVLLLDSLNRHMLGSYGGTEFETPRLDRFARERAVRFTSHVTGSLPCMPARHDILCGSLDFLWRPWGSIEVWEEPITRQLRRAGVTTMLVSDHPHLFEVGGENYHTDFERVGVRARPRGRPVADVPRPQLHRRAGVACPWWRVVLAGPPGLGRRRGSTL